jgi:uncharacterized membrane protein
MSTYERNANWITVFLLLLEVGLAVMGVMRLSGPIPIHFNGSGEANRWGSPSTLLVLAFVDLTLVGLLWISKSVPTELMNFPGARTTDNVAKQRQNIDQLLATIRVIVAALFLCIMGQIIWISLYHKQQIFPWPSFLFIALIFISTFIGLFRAYRLSASR